MVVHLLTIYFSFFIFYFGKGLGLRVICPLSLAEPGCSFQMPLWFQGRNENIREARELQRARTSPRVVWSLSCCLQGWGVCQMCRLTVRDGDIKQMIKSSNFTTYWAPSLWDSCLVFRYNISKSGNGLKRTFIPPFLDSKGNIHLNNKLLLREAQWYAQGHTEIKWQLEFSPIRVWHKSLSSFHCFRMLGIAQYLIFIINKVCVFDSIKVYIFFQVWNLFCSAVFSEWKDRVIKALGSRAITLDSKLSSVPHFRHSPGQSLCFYFLIWKMGLTIAFSKGPLTPLWPCPGTQQSTQSMRTFSKFQGQQLSVYLNSLYSFLRIHWTNVSSNLPRCCCGTFIGDTKKHKTQYIWECHSQPLCSSSVYKQVIFGVLTEFKVLGAVLGTYWAWNG